MPVVFTPYLKDRLGVADPEEFDEPPEPVTPIDTTVDVLTRREFLAAAAAIGVAVLALRRRRSGKEESPPEAEA